MRRQKHRGLVGALMEMERLEDVAKFGGLACIGCGWGCDDPELELCCDCADAEFMRAARRGDYGKDEQREARASVAIGQGDDP